MANTWGTNKWGENSWGQQDDVIITQTGLSVASSIGTATTQANADHPVGSVSATLSIATDSFVGGSTDIPVQTLSAQFAVGQAVSNIGVNSGEAGELSTAISDVTIDDRFLIGEGWGRDVWGGWAWGVNYSVELGSLQLNAVTGNEDAFTDVDIQLQGFSISADIESVGTSANSDTEIAHSFGIQTNINPSVVTGTANVTPDSQSITIDLADVEAAPKQEVNVSGLSMSFDQSDTTQIGTANVDVSGIAMTFAQSDVTPVSIYDSGSVSASFELGSVSVTGQALVELTGIGMSIAQPSVSITAWAEINTGTTVTWSDVDQAA